MRSRRARTSTSSCGAGGSVPPWMRHDDLGGSVEVRFEDAARELEQIVQQLESGQADLDDAIKLWERGEELHRLCLEKLDSAQGRIEALKPVEPA